MKIKNSKQVLFEQMHKVTGMPLNEYNNWDYPAGADADRNAPWHQSDSPEISDWDIDKNLTITFYTNASGVEPYQQDLDMVVPEEAHEVWSAVEANSNDPKIPELIKPYVDKWIANNESSIEWETYDPRDDMYENKTPNDLTSNILQAIPENTGVQELATAIGNILKDQYGQHNYKLFMETLHNYLGI